MNVKIENIRQQRANFKFRYYQQTIGGGTDHKIMPQKLRIDIVLKNHKIKITKTII